MDADQSYLDMLEDGTIDKTSALRQLEDEFDSIFASVERLQEVYDHFGLSELAYETAGISRTLVEMRRMSSRAKADAKREYVEKSRG